MNLKHFTSCETIFKGIFENFVLSRQIQSLNIDDIETYKFEGAYKMNENLRSLVWYYGYDKSIQPVSFKCPRLEKLIVKSGSIPIEMILQLESLYTLSISDPRKLTYSYVIRLLRDHVSLKEFKLEYNYQRLDPEPAPEEAFTCAENVKSIEISLLILENNMYFWLDLMGKNPLVKFVLRGFCTSELLKNVLNSPKFPYFIKTIYIDAVKVGELRKKKNH